MKKSNFYGFKNVLSRDEMKSLNGSIAPEGDYCHGNSGDFCVVGGIGCCLSMACVSDNGFSGSCSNDWF